MLPGRTERAMPGQLPERGEVFLDHVAHFVPALDPAAEAFVACGFRLTPYAAQQNRLDGGTVSAGTANRCAMLRRGYVEILGATGDTPLARQLEERLQHHVGLHLAAFSSAEAAAEHRRLAATGFAVEPLVDMGRPAAVVSDGSEARFTIARIAPGQMPEGRIQFLTHRTPDLVWPAAYLEHPNGAEALAALWIAAADIDAAAARFARFTGRPSARDGETASIALDRGVLRFAAPAFLECEFGIAPGPQPPYLAAYEILTAGLDPLRRALDAGGLSARPFAAGFAVALPPAVGGTILFRTQHG
jgi:Glyoxalase-like domain